jgi:hypothetical protein
MTQTPMKNNLYESLFIIRQNIDTIHYLVEVMRDHGFHLKKDSNYTDKERHHYISLFFHILLNTVSVIDEYNENFYQLAEPHFQEKVLTVKKILKPVFKKMSGWADLKKVRNELVAHPKRTMASKDFSLKYLWKYNAPRNYMDLQILLKYLGVIDAILQTEFEKEMDPMLHYIESVSIAIENNTNYSNAEKDMVALQDKVNAKCKTHGKNYRINIYHIGKVDNYFE